MQVAWGYASERRLRDENQDRYGAFEFAGRIVGVVCDGLGGHAGGGAASAIAVRAIHEVLDEQRHSDPAKALLQSIQRANVEVYDASRKGHRLVGMGTTVAAALIVGNTVHVAHVGDSRVYLVREGTARALTRDHTMVNLFVEAELLSPEDAASHPEAHVLSRSLGSEREVDVEVMEAIAIRPGDAIVLCTDGVHGVLTDWEFASVDWTEPQEAVEAVLSMVASREGDDNATIVALVQGVEPRTVMPQSEIPDPDAVEVSNPGPGNVSATFTEAQPEQIVIGASPFQDRATQQPFPKAPLPPPPKRPAATRPLLLAAAGLTGLAVLGFAGFLLTRGSAPTPKAPVDPPAQPVVATVDTDAESNAAVHTDDAPLPPPQSDPCAVGFAIELPPVPARAPHRSERYHRGRPPGLAASKIVNDARADKCRDAFDATRRGMQESVNYAQTYDDGWSCFDRVFGTPLTKLGGSTSEELAALIPYFEGPEGPMFPGPDWARPARDGLEYRLEAFEDVGAADLIHDVVFDRLGPQRVAIALGDDLYAEARAAAAYACLPSPSETDVERWARRVFVVTRALDGPAREAIDQYWPAMAKEIRRYLDAAMLRHDLDRTPPEPVQRAYRAASGAEPLAPELVDAMRTYAGRMQVPKARETLRDSRLDGGIRKPKAPDPSKAP